MWSFVKRVKYSGLHYKRKDAIQLDLPRTDGDHHTAYFFFKPSLTLPTASVKYSMIIEIYRNDMLTGSRFAVSHHIDRNIYVILNHVANVYGHKRIPPQIEIIKPIIQVYPFIQLWVNPEWRDWLSSHLWTGWLGWIFSPTLWYTGRYSHWKCNH